MFSPFRIYTFSAIFIVSILKAQVNPQLIIDTKGHTAPITGLFFINDGENLLSVSQDKTIRIWETGSQLLKRTLRINIGSDVIGSIYCADYYPERDLLALGGYLAAKTKSDELGKIILIKVSTGEIADELFFHKSTINALQFSPSGNFLLSGDSEGKLACWTRAGTTFKLKNAAEAHFHGVTCIAASNEYVVSGGTEGTLKRWKINENGLERAESSTLHTGGITSVAITENSNYIASTGEDKKLILYNSSFESIEEISDVNLAVLQFGKEGSSLLTGGENPNMVKVFTVPELNMLTQFNKHDDLVTALAFHNDLIASAGGTNFDIYVWEQNSPMNSERFTGKGAPKLSVGIDDDMNIAFTGKRNDNNNPINDAQLEKGISLRDFFILNTPSNSKFKRETLNYRQFPLEKISDRELQIDENTAIELAEKNDIIRSYSYTKDGNIVIASDFSLDLYNSEGDYLKSFEGHNGTVWSAVVSEDNKFIISCGDDQTIRLWNPEAKGEYESAWEFYSGNEWQAYFKKKGLTSLAQKKGKTAWNELINKIEQFGDKDAGELKESINFIRCIVKPTLSIFVSSDNEWVVWTEDGYYNASAGGEKLIGWQINGSEGKLAQFYPASAFRSKFFKPEMISSILKNPDYKIASEEIITPSVTTKQEVQKVKPVETTSQTILNSLPPKITFVSPSEYKTVSTQETFKIKVKVQSDKKINEVKLFVNGVKYTVGKKPKANGDQLVFRSANEKTNDSLYSFDVQLSEEENSIVVYASNENGNSVSEEKIIELEKTKNEKAEKLLIKPNLYMVSIGVSTFIDANNNLDFADDDAREMTKLFKAQQGLLYNEVQVKELTDEQATRLNILESFSWLERNVTNKDVAVIFIATHGFNQKEKFYILPADGEYDKFRATCVDWSDFGEILKNLPCRTVLFLDACHSGQLGKNLYTTRGAEDSNTEAIRELASEESGIVILSASTGAEKSLESKSWGHGAFTYSILSAVQTREGDVNKNNIIYLNELEYYIAENVKKLTEGQQHPTTQKPSTISTLPLFQLDK
jgi:WD40 repeat protein